ncbi:MAG TPA: shikimate kinase [Xanthomonadaceae bacterium]
MKLLILGNSGSGKSTLAKAVAERHGLPHLDLDIIVWEPGQIAVARTAEAVRADLDAFIAAHPRWVIEGCYGELIEVAAPASTRLLFLNPGLEACLANNRRRPWEPHKYASAEAQDAMLDNLQSWVAGYYSRDDAWSLAAHRRVFDRHPGEKREAILPLSPADLD